jgi:hypothetical protein
MFNSWKPKHYLESGAKPLPEGFHYASDSNPEWLNEASMAKLLTKP